MKRTIFKALGSILAVIGAAILINSFTGKITGFAIVGEIGRGVTGSIIGMGFIIGGILLIAISINEEQKHTDKNLRKQ